MMKPQVKFIGLVLFLAVILIPARFAHADTGPKPTMDFQFTFESGVPQSGIVSGILFECEDSECSDAQPLQEVGPQGLNCEVNSCRALGYGFAPYHILEIEFSDGVTRRSNVFETGGFDSFYTVYVRAGDLFVEPKINPLAAPAWVMALVACACLIAGGGVVGVLVILARRRAKT